MTTTNLIYDARFIKGNFTGYRVTCPDEGQDKIWYKSHYYWATGGIRSSVIAWLQSHGPWKNNGLDFYFAREETAMLFKLKYC